MDNWIRNDYYPFGLKHKGYNNVVTSTNPAQNYKYNGKELNEELGLNWYDYGSRNYQPDLGRWFNPDPLAEKYYPMSPYNYTANNPIRFVDYDGEDFGIEIDHKNKTIKITGNYYFSSNSDYNENKAALAAWSKFTGSYETKDGETYSISFDLKGSVVAPGSKAEAKAKNDPIGNFVTEESVDANFEAQYKKDGGTENPKDVGGYTKGADEIYNKSSVANQQTREHEVGHTLGLDENEGGVMNYQSSFSSMKNVTKGNATKVVKRTFEFLNRIKNGKKIKRAVPLKGKPKETGTYEGSGSFYDKKKIKIN